MDDHKDSLGKLLYVMSCIASDCSLNAWNDAITELREIGWNKRIAITKHATQDLYVTFDFLGVTDDNDGMLVSYDTREQLGLASMQQDNGISLQDGLILVDDLPYRIFDLATLLISDKEAYIQSMSVIANALEKEGARDQFKDECDKVTAYLNEHSDIPLHKHGPCLDRLKTIYDALSNLDIPLSIDQYRRQGDWSDLR